MFGFHLVSKTIKIFQTSPALFLALAIFLLLFGTETGWAASASSAIQDGITDYQQKNYEQAESNFSKAAQELPNDANLNYNLGNSQYKTGKFQEALQTYSKTMTETAPPELKGKTLYNTGNTLFRLGKLEEAATAYKKALEVNPKDMDSKFNLEFVREQLKKKEEEQKKQPPLKDSNSKDKQDPQSKDSSDNEEDDRGDPSDPKNQGSDSNPKPEENGEPSPAEQQDTPNSQQAEVQEGAISKDQADHWLSAIDENLKKFLQKQAGKEQAGRPNQNKDW